MTHQTQITIHHIYISPGHNYFGHDLDQPGAHPTHDVDEVAALAGLGLVGDRFYGVRPDFDGQVTLFAWEVFAALQAQLARPEIAPAQLRRNVVVAGVALNALIGHEFEIAYADGAGVRLAGVKHCAPCRWMDAGVAQGALQFLKGRGGLRCQILRSGVIRQGAAQLVTAAPLGQADILQPLARPKLPG
ncbi:MAG: MOSC domain-containing protein [Caldilineaceae bacterium]